MNGTHDLRYICLHMSGKARLLVCPSHWTLDKPVVSLFTYHLALEGNLFFRFLYSIFYVSAVLSRGWAKASACCFQECLSCAVLCQVVSFQYSSKSFLHLFAGLPHNLFLPYGFQVVMRFFYYCQLKFTFLLHLAHTCRKTHPRGPACILTWCSAFRNRKQLFRIYVDQTEYFETIPFFSNWHRAPQH